MLKAFHGEQALKDAAVARMRAHRKNDTLVQGTYWDKPDPDGEYRGCAIGCLVAEDLYRERGARGPVWMGATPFYIGASEMRMAYPRLLGLPWVFSRIHEMIFENLRPEEAALWPEQVLEATPVGVDLTDWAEATWRRLDRDASVGRHDDLDAFWRGWSDRVLAELRAMVPVEAPEPMPAAPEGQPITV